jgi:hypothetical protein
MYASNDKQQRTAKPHHSILPTKLIPRRNTATSSQFKAAQPRTPTSNAPSTKSPAKQASSTCSSTTPAKRPSTPHPMQGPNQPQNRPPQKSATTTSTTGRTKSGPRLWIRMSRPCLPLPWLSWNCWLKATKGERVMPARRASLAVRSLLLAVWEGSRGSLTVSSIMLARLQCII